MAWLKYYEEERERYPEEHVAKLTTHEAEVAIRKLARHFKVRIDSVSFTSGNRSSHASGNRIVLNVDYLNWLTVIHEFAHCWHHVDQEKRAVRAQLDQHKGLIDIYMLDRRLKRIRSEVAHGKNHARLVDRGVAYMHKKGWMTGVIEASKQQREEKRAALTHEKEKLKDSYDVRIGRRWIQIHRLTKKIKALTTRLKKAQRSMAALERAKKKKQEAGEL